MISKTVDRLCGLVVRVLGYRSGGLGSILGTTRFSEKKKRKTVVGLERCPLSLVSTTEKLLDRKVAAPVQKSENTDVGIRHADHVAPFIRKSWQLLRRQAAVARSVYSLANSDHGVFFLVRQCAKVIVEICFVWNETGRRIQGISGSRLARSRFNIIENISFIFCKTYLKNNENI
jgi:hypothetical protein